MPIERLLGVSAVLLAVGCGNTASNSEEDSEGTGGSGGAGDCVDLSHFDEQAGDPMRGKWNLRVIGTGFEADEGETVRVVVTLGEPSYGLAETVIRNGSFDVALPGTIEPYTGLGLYIDRVKDDACDVDGDSLFQMTTGGVFGDYLWEVTPDTRMTPEIPACTINAIFDLAVPLPCP